MQYLKANIELELNEDQAFTDIYVLWRATVVAGQACLSFA